MKRTLSTLLIGLTLCCSAPLASAAAYIKIQDIKGESQHSAPASDRDLRPQPAPRAGMLLPAVQKVREAARPAKPKPKPQSDHSAGDEHEIEYDVSAGS